MPTGVKILVRMEELPSQFSPPEQRSEFMQAMSLTEGDFRFGGPLQLVSGEDRLHLPVPDENGFWLDVNLWNAYYGIGYERGDIELFIKCAEWLEHRFPGCQVYYGHDVDDENLRLFDKAARDELLRHYWRSRE